MALTGKTIAQLTKYTSSLTGNELFPLEYNGATYHVSQSQFSASYAPNIYNTDGTLTGNRTLSISSNKLIVTSTTPTTNYTFTLGTPTGVTVPSWPANQIKQGEFNISSPSTAEIETTTYWGRNQTAASKDLWVNQIIANVTAESTGRTSLYNQVYTTTRGSVLDTSLSTTATLIGTWNKIGHTYTSTQATTASIVTSELRALYNDIINYAGTITNAYGVKTQAVISNTTSAKNSAITNFYGYYLQTSTGTSSGPTGSITNLYGIYLDTPIVGATGTITNRWGLYAPDTVMNHFIGGKVGIGTTSPAYTLDVNGTARVSGGTTLVVGANNVTTLNLPQWNSLNNGFDFLMNDDGILKFRRINTSVATNMILFDRVANGMTITESTNLILPSIVSNSGGQSVRIRLRNDSNVFVGWDDDETVKLAVTNDGFSRYVSLGGSTTSGTVFNAVLTVKPNVSSVGIGIKDPNASSILDITSTTKGLLLPRMTNAQRTAISTPAVGLIVYCTDTTEGLYVYKSTGWTFIV